MNDINQKIKDYFLQENIKNNLDELVEKYFINEDQKTGFLNVFELIKEGEFDVDDLPEYMSDWLGVNIERALEFYDEFFEKIISDIYYDLDQIYQTKKQQKLENYHQEMKPKKQKNEPLTKQSTVEQKVDLAKLYQEFIKSSFIQDVKNSQVGLKDQDVNSRQFKNTFYQSINDVDKVKVVAGLRLIFENSPKDFFAQDKRYQDFISNYLLSKDKTEAGNFKANPGVKKYIILFLRLILEKKLKIAEQDSAMIGVMLGSLASQSGQNNFADIAFGDEDKAKFSWNNF